MPSEMAKLLLLHLWHEHARLLTVYSNCLLRGLMGRGKLGRESLPEDCLQHRQRMPTTVRQGPLTTNLSDLGVRLLIVHI